MIYYYIWLFAQIVLESFPISSSGHMVLIDYVLNKIDITSAAVNVEQASALNIFEHVDILEHFAHGATIIVLAVFFFSRWTFLLRNIKRCWRIILKIIGLGIIADAITSIFYIFFHYYDISNYFPLPLGFLITACLLFSLRFCSQRNGTFNWRVAALLGVVQGCALLPGISRLASTFVAARWCGISPRKSFEISWLIVTPLLLAAFLNSVRLIIVEHQAAFLFSAPIIATIIVATFIAYFCLCFIARLAYSNRLWKLGIYMVIVCLMTMIAEI